jgi:IS4 transposase
VARPKGIDVPAELKRLFPTRWLRETAREVGLTRRRRKIDPAALFWTLVLGFGAGSQRSIASLRRFHGTTTGLRLVASSFYVKLNDRTVRFLKRAVLRAVEKAAAPSRRLAGRLSAFKDLVVIDETLVRLHRFLARAFPGTRTNHSPASAKVHLVMSVLGGGPSRVKIVSGRTSEHETIRIGKWVKGRLLLFDLGFFKYQLFDRIRRNGGFFLTRLKSSANPVVTAILRTHRGRARELVGRSLREAAAGLSREIVDCEVEARVRHRPYDGHQRSEKETFRVVGIRDDVENDYHWYVTNIPPEDLAAEDVRVVYAARWEVETIFKEMKSLIRLDEFPSSKRHVVEALILAAVLALAVSRRLWQALDRAVDAGRRLAERRVTEMLGLLAHAIVPALLGRPSDNLRRFLRQLLLAEGLDPNVNRAHLLDPVRA